MVGIRTFQPNLASIMDEMAPSFYTEQEKEVVGKLFPTCEKISIDYAVMEKSKEIYTLPAEFGWSDLGSWGSLRTLLPQDDKKISQNGNDIMAYLIEWRQLVRCNKEKLSYASTSLKMNKMDVESTFM